MAEGVQVFTDNGKQWIDVVQPSWVLDMRVEISGNGSATYNVDSRFQLRVMVLNYVVNRNQHAPTFTVSGNKVSWSAPASCTFIVVMEAK